MELQDMLGGPRGPASHAGLLELPNELLLPILRRVEGAGVESGRTSAEFLQLRAVCKKLKQAMDAAVTNLSWGVARGFCRSDAVLPVKDALQRQLARWGAGLRRVELHIRGDSTCALAQLLPALGQTCPGLTALHIVNTGFEEPATGRRGPYEALAPLSSLASLESLSLSGFQTFSGSLPSLPSLRVLDTDFGKLLCAAPLPALEELAHGSFLTLPATCTTCRHLSPPVATCRHLSPCGILSGASGQETFALRVPRTAALPRLRRLSLGRMRSLRLRLPKSLEVLELVNVDLDEEVDLGEDLLELTVLLVVYEGRRPFPLCPAGLSTLLSQNCLRQLTLQCSKSAPSRRVLVPGTLSLATHMTALSLQSVSVPHLQEALAALTALTELELRDLTHLEAADFSRLRLQHLRLEELPKLCVMDGLELQTCVRSLTLAGLPLTTHLPDLHVFPRLAVLELTSLGLESWNPDTCSDLPRLTQLRVSNVRQLAVDQLPAVKGQTKTASRQLSKVSQLAPQAAAAVPPRVQARRPPPPGAALVLPDLGSLRGLHQLTELDLGGFAGSTVDAASLPVLKRLRLHDCPGLSHLSGLHLLPYLHSLELGPSLPKLRTLTLASCPRLTSVSCRSKDLLSLTLEGLPQLRSLGRLPDSLRSLHVATCPSLEKLEVGTLGSGGMSEVNRRMLSMLQSHASLQLRTVKLVALAKLSSLSIKDATLLESVHVSDCPLAELVLENLPNLTAASLHVNDLYLHAADCILPPSAASSPPPTPYLPPPTSPQSPQVLRKLALIWLPGHLTLHRVALQTGLTHLTLDGLHLLRMPREMSSLTGLSELVLRNLEVESAEPLPPNAFSRLEKVAIAGGGTNLVEWTGLGPAWVGAPPHLQVDGGLVAHEIGAFRSITSLVSQS